MITRDANDERILILAPRGKDAALACDAAANAGVHATTCANLASLISEMRSGAGALLIAEEALSAGGIDELADAMADEPGWSELPIVVLVAASAYRDARLHLARLLEPLRNVTLVDRPVSIEGFVSTMRAALRARRRQYEIRDLMSELQRALRTRDAFVAAVSHELRTPLNVILGWASALQRPSGDPAHAARIGSIIDRNARVLSQLVEDLIDVSRMTNGSFQLRLADVELSAIVRTSVETLRPMAEAKNIELTCTTADHVATVRGDEVRLQQVVWNLVWNALKFTAAGGRIDITLRQTDDDAEIIVSDTGVGIAPELLPYIFEPFRQGSAAPGDPHRGLGLGLAIVRHLIELHGGSITATSEGVGRGSRFEVRLPMVRDTTGSVEAFAASAARVREH